MVKEAAKPTFCIPLLSLSCDVGSGSALPSNGQEKHVQSHGGAQSWALALRFPPPLRRRRVEGGTRRHGDTIRLFLSKPHFLWLCQAWPVSWRS